MAIQPMSSTPVPADYLDPDGRPDSINEDWEAGPIAVEDTSQGLKIQAWHLTFAAGVFTITPEDTGLPVDVLTGQDSIQCTFAFDQNGRPTIAWEDSADNAYLYWYDTVQGEFVIYQFEQTPIWGLALTLDDKREMQVGASDIQLWYTLPHPTVSGQYILYCRYQRDRYDTPYERSNPAWPYIHKCGMNEGLRVQLSLSTESP